MEQASDQTVTDPVCLMQITPNDAVAHSEYQGRRYYFCAESCHRAFEQDPDRYTRHAA